MSSKRGDGKSVSARCLPGNEDTGSGNTVNLERASSVTLVPRPSSYSVLDYANRLPNEEKVVLRNPRLTSAQWVMKFPVSHSVKMLT